MLFVCLSAHTRMKSVEFDWCAQSCRQTMWKLVEGDRAAKTAAGSKERAVAAAAAAGVSVWVPVLRCAALRCATLLCVLWFAACACHQQQQQQQSKWLTDRHSSHKLPVWVASSEWLSPGDTTKKCCSLSSHSHLCCIHKVVAIHWSIAFQLNKSSELIKRVL